MFIFCDCKFSNSAHAGFCLPGLKFRLDKLQSAEDFSQ
jgi:hypothetical protein